MDGIQYHNSKLDMIATAEGYAEPMGSNNKFKYKYDLKDQLGSVHATIGRDSATHALRHLYHENEKIKSVYNSFVADIQPFKPCSGPK